MNAGHVVESVLLISAVLILGSVNIGVIGLVLYVDPWMTPPSGDILVQMFMLGLVLFLDASVLGILYQNAAGEDSGG